MAYLLQFGTYVFPGTYWLAETPRSQTIGRGKLPRQHGARQLRGFLDEHRFTVRGGDRLECGMGATPLRDKLDALYAALAGQGPVNFYAGESDRFYRCVQCEAVSPILEGRWGERVARVDISLVTDDPFRYSTTENANTEAIAASGETWVVPTGGNAPAAPVIEATVGGAGAQTIAFEIENQTTGQAFTLAGTVVGGQVIVVDPLAETVMIGSQDRMDLFDGEFLSLAVGANTLAETYTSGSLTQVKTIWRNRWY